MKQKKEVKLVHFTLVNATGKEVKQFKDAVMPLADKISENLDYDIQFLLSNNDVKLTDLKPLIDHLTVLYDKYEALRQKKLDKMYSKPEPDEK